MSGKSAFLSILGLSAFAIANPILSTLGRGATFFVTHGADASDVLLFTAAIYLLPPLLLTALVICIGRVNKTAGRVSVSIVLGILAGVWALTFVTGMPSQVAFVLALLIAASVTILHLRFAPLRNVLPILGAASPIIVVAFLFFTPVNRLLGDGGYVAKFDGAGSDTPVVLLLFDELSLAIMTTPDGEVDAGRLPNFARLANRSTWYDDTTTVSTLTQRAVPAILSGVRTHMDTVPIYREFPRNLFTVFSPTHTITAFESYTDLCPDSICGKGRLDSRLSPDFSKLYQDAGVIWLHGILPATLAERFLPSIATQWGSFLQTKETTGELSSSARMRALKKHNDRDHIQQFHNFIDTLEASSGPSLIYLHFGLPHNPWLYFPDGNRYNGLYTPGLSLQEWPEEQRIADQAILRYALQVEYVDRLLGQTLDVLEQTGRFDETLLIVASDHGVAFTPGQHRRIPVATTLADVSRVPLFIKYPGQKSAKRDSRKVETIDIFPTIAEAVQVPLHAQLDGQSLTAEDWAPVRRKLLEGDNLPSDIETVMDMRKARKRVYDVIDAGVSALDTIGTGAGAALIGKALKTTGDHDTQSELQLFETGCHDQLVPEGVYIPARVAGKVTGATIGDNILATLNGIVAGSSEVMASDGHVSILLHPQYFSSAGNELRAYILRDESASELTINCELKDPKGLAL